MKFKTVLAAFLLLAFAPLQAIACDYPARVKVPSGATASKEEMIEGQRAVKDYVAAMEAYLDCLVAEEKALRAGMDNLSPEDEQLREDLLTKKYNAAIDEMEKIAANFNAEVRIYKERTE